jgi:hypothetical protein
MSDMASRSRVPESVLLRERARYAARKAIDDGVLIKPDRCSACQSGGWIEGHHPDYSKPLDVLWLCRRCHKQFHKTNSEEATRRPAKEYRAGDPGLGDVILCKCGCGEMMHEMDGYKRRRVFRRGHWIKWALQSYSRSVEEWTKTKGDLE